MQEIWAEQWRDPEIKSWMQYDQEEIGNTTKLTDRILKEEQELDEVQRALMGLDIPSNMAEYWKETTLTGQDFAHYWNETFLNPMADKWIKEYRQKHPKEKALVEESLVTGPHRRRLISLYTPCLSWIS